MCIKDGEWPERLHDVEEMEKALLEQHKRQIEQDLGISSDQKEDSR
jgi:hypothetical protein